MEAHDQITALPSNLHNPSVIDGAPIKDTLDTKVIEKLFFSLA